MATAAARPKRAAMAADISRANTRPKSDMEMRIPSAKTAISTSRLASDAESALPPNGARIVDARRLLTAKAGRRRSWAGGSRPVKVDGGASHRRADANVRQARRHGDGRTGRGGRRRHPTGPPCRRARAASRPKMTPPRSTTSGSDQPEDDQNRGTKGKQWPCPAANCTATENARALRAASISPPVVSDSAAMAMR